MKKFFKIFAIILAVLVLIAGAFWLVYYASFKSNLWLKFPEPLRTQTALTHLEMSDIENVICHEDCMYERQAYRQIIADYLSKNGADSQVAGAIKKTFLDEESDPQLRQDLVRVLKMSEDAKKKDDSAYAIKAPKYLIDYLSASAGDSNLKDVIVSEFSSDYSLVKGAASSLLAKVKNTELGLGERIPALKNLSSLINKDVAGPEKSTTTGPIPVLKDVVDYPEICKLFMNVAEEKGDMRLRYAAVNSLYACVNYKDYYSEDNFNRLQSLLFNEENHPEIQGGIVFNLSKYYIVDKEKTIAVMEKIYQDKSLHLFTIDGAAGFLKEKGIAGYPEPVISEEADLDYAQHMDEVRYYEDKNIVK